MQVLLRTSIRARGGAKGALLRNCCSRKRETGWGQDSGRKETCGAEREKSF